MPNNLILFGPKRVMENMKNGSEIFFDNGKFFSEPLTISTLKISNINRKAAGSYECVATSF